MTRRRRRRRATIEQGMKKKKNTKTPKHTHYCLALRTADLLAHFEKRAHTLYVQEGRVHTTSAATTHNKTTKASLPSNIINIYAVE